MEQDSPAVRAAVQAVVDDHLAGKETFEGIARIYNDLSDVDKMNADSKYRRSMDELAEKIAKERRSRES